MSIHIASLVSSLDSMYFASQEDTKIFIDVLLENEIDMNQDEICTMQ